MTATPDKRDDNLEGRNIYEIFNHQIAYEIRLQDAMKEDLLCPFHYFGITDLEVIADAGKSSEEKFENFKYLTSDERVLNVMKQAKFFGYSGERVKGLIFCSRIEDVYKRQCSILQIIKISERFISAWIMILPEMPLVRSLQKKSLTIRW